MKRTAILFALLLCANFLIAQNENIDTVKNQHCKIDLNIHYKDSRADYEFAKPLDTVELLFIYFDKKGRITEKKTGYLKTRLIDGKYFTYFISSENIRNSKEVAEFPVFKNVLCYRLNCYNSAQ